MKIKKFEELNEGVTKKNELEFNQWLVKLQKDLKQNKYNLKKAGLYTGEIKKGVEKLISVLKEDYDM